MHTDTIKFIKTLIDNKTLKPNYHSFDNWKKAFSVDVNQKGIILQNKDINTDYFTDHIDEIAQDMFESDSYELANINDDMDVNIFRFVFDADNVDGDDSGDDPQDFIDSVDFYDYTKYDYDRYQHSDTPSSIEWITPNRSYGPHQTDIKYDIYVIALTDDECEYMTKQ